MKNGLRFLLTIWIAIVLVSCDSEHAHQHETDQHGEEHDHDDHEPEKEGTHGGRILQQGEFALELTIVEAGVPPEFRVWVTEHGKPVSPQSTELVITLTRLGGAVDRIQFSPQHDYLRGDTEIIEPHSFLVTVEAKYAGKNYHWEYENFEGRTQIDAELAKSFGLKTAIAGEQTMVEYVPLHGSITLDPARIANVTARFDGVLKSVNVAVGEQVKKGQVLANVESNESLTTYSLRSPISGTLTQRNANTGESTENRNLFTVTDTSIVWVQLSVFPANRSRIKVGDSVLINAINNDQVFHGNISFLNVLADQSQALQARVVLENPSGALIPGTHVIGQVQVAEYTVPVAVKRPGLQRFRDFTVVYVQFGDHYEVRMLDLGRQDGDWVEVLKGIDSGTPYVSENSYLLKADIEKAGASHNH